MTAPTFEPRLSVVIPVKDEAGNIEPLLAEIETACAELAPFEVVYVDDGSTDATFSELQAARARRPWLRVIQHDRCAGKAAGMRTGVRYARAPIIAVLDGDCQNDPAFIPAMYAAVFEGGETTGLCAGQRIGRKDGRFKSWQSRIANGVRGRILKDATRDTGCGFKVFRRDLYLALPHFDGLHRFLPALVSREGYRVTHRDVVDRPRLAGVSKYGLFNRLWVGLMDLAGVWWLIRRAKTIPASREIPAGGTSEVR
ncbi:glycosyltransferase family 2 protein [Methylobacterium gnaphalii]|uniref:Dolichol-phosphate mannosyltransferase n=1 Tax=Methylobacterium gnaphalii TaxID=1010610 RepID=A0A512JNI2_9HYPH|nr:glycosyltransferase family 2 protein [Methylobacterium gnaphalii]GEP11488.1 dolichol-phosphate mannosyltransferase [Methylobacterium gnaphalii]GJD70178.1 Dodecaprenyl-phosphate galacturonate synthase [Methylobacterium gnaphalii]GLS49492.1 dolichol-phosphate mannosyltransferase [Methylobacterium gnaphalii]